MPGNKQSININLQITLEDGRSSSDSHTTIPPFAILVVPACSGTSVSFSVDGAASINDSQPRSTTACESQSPSVPETEFSNSFSVRHGSESSLHGQIPAQSTAMIVNPVQQDLQESQEDSPNTWLRTSFKRPRFERTTDKSVAPQINQTNADDVWIGKVSDSETEPESSIDPDSPTPKGHLIE